MNASLERKLHVLDDPLSSLETEFLLLSASCQRFDEITQRLESYLLDPWSSYSFVWMVCKQANTIAVGKAHDMSVIVTTPKLQQQISTLNFGTITSTEDDVTVSITQTGLPRILNETDGIRSRRANSFFVIFPVKVIFREHDFDVYDLSVEIQPSWPPASSTVRFTLASTPRFIKSAKYYDVVALAPAENRARDRIRGAIVKAITDSLGDIKLGFAIPDAIKAIAPGAAPFHASVSDGLMICSQGLGAKRNHVFRNAPSPPFDIGFFLDKGYFARLVAQSLQERQVTLTETTFEAWIIRIECRFTNRTEFWNGTNGYIDLRIDWKYQVTFEEPVNNGWVANARAIWSEWETTGVCSGFLCDYFESEVEKQADRIVSETKLVTVRLADLQSIAATSKVYSNSHGLIIDITEVPK